MAELGKKLGKLSLAILENFVEGKLGKKFIDELRAPTDRARAIEKALGNSESRFAKEFKDPFFAKEIFTKLNDEDLKLLSDAIDIFFDHPTDPHLTQSLNQVLLRNFPNKNANSISSASDSYIKILIEELALADEMFRENVRTLADLRGGNSQDEMVEILKRVEKILMAGSRNPAAAGIGVDGNADGSAIVNGNNNQIGVTNIYPPNSTPQMHASIGYTPAAKVTTYIHRGKTEEDVVSFLRAGGNGAIVGVHAPGGLGKTELAKQAAEAVKDLYEGILWVDVGENTPAQVVNAMLISCGIQASPTATDETKKSELRAYLQTRKLLVVFDDVRGSALTGMADFLPPKPCSSLITSRIQQMSGIKAFPLDHMTVEQARELMRAILGDNIVDAEMDMADALAERLAWNPLAMEIATRRIVQSKVTKPIEGFFKKVHARFPELHMDGDVRWDMRKIFDISYEDLSGEDQKRFRALAVFHATGFAPPAAAFLCELDEIETNRMISRFMNLSLLKPVVGDVERYRFHDLLDEYASLLLNENGERDEIYGKFTTWLIELFETHYTDDLSSAPEVLPELENLRHATKHAIDKKDSSLLALLATKPRNWLYNIFRIHREWETWMQTSLKFGVEDKQLKANVLQAIGDVQQFRDERDAALESYHEALKLFQAVGDRLGEANVYLSLGGLKRTESAFAGAIDDFKNAFAIYKLIGDRYSQARALYRRSY